jgi:hypothetical protein
MSVKVLNTLASDTSKVEDPVKGSIAKSVVVRGRRFPRVAITESDACEGVGARER